MFRRRTPAGEGLTVFIDEGSEIEGRCAFTGAAMLNGKFKGEIASTGTVIIGQKGVINADIRAGQVLVSGEVVGNVRATERVELKGTARMFGDIDAPVIVVEEGGVFEGHCHMNKVSPIPEAPPSRDLSVVPLKR